jgi:hypothetical protein
MPNLNHEKMKYQEKMKRENARKASEQKQTVDKSSRAKQLCVAFWAAVSSPFAAQRLTHLVASGLS